MAPSQQWEEGLTRLLYPPGFPPIQGLESAEPTQQSLVGVLETAMKLANHDEGSEEEEDEAPKKVQGGQGWGGGDNRTEPWETLA